ncbi:DUF6702 family protein [Marinirhabdus gelatinilytica]|uniref:Peptidase E n=1 Tax=Marinirhabdus gelatinilytica TaxID=1703343 RepID=A0A370Q8F6_9FLAO|nr:DUF6702 family protein [Marinirhabdus gelatinilytica]RDK84646.1 hypothetical protein C8D94_10418 [Marinirhabdus gelatinilytica]
MKFLKTALVLFLVPLLTSSVDHKFYVSITSIEHAPKEESLQIITKIFLDDIEDALEKRYNRKFKFNSQKEKEEDELILKDYVFQKLKVKANGTPATLNYIGREYDIDVVKIYIEIPNVPTLKTIEIENQVLFDMFTDQQNIVHIRNGDTRRSLILENQNPKGLLNFNQ